MLRAIENRRRGRREIGINAIPAFIVLCTSYIVEMLMFNVQCSINEFRPTNDIQLKKKNHSFGLLFCFFAVLPLGYFVFKILFLMFSCSVVEFHIHLLAPKLNSFIEMLFGSVVLQY